MPPAQALTGQTGIDANSSLPVFFRGKLTSVAVSRYNQQWKAAVHQEEFP